MSRSSLSLQDTGADNPWSRLPWVILISLMIWGALLFGFGTLLGHMTQQPEQIAPIDAQIIELHPLNKHAVIPKLAMPTPVRQFESPPPQRVESADKPVTQAPEPPAPVVSLPSTNLQSNTKTVPNSNLPVVEPRPTGTSRGSNNPTAPPQFGVAYLNNPKPNYPAFAKRTGMQGTVILKVLVSREGTALKVALAKSSGHDILDEAAIDAIKQWRFVPARAGDYPVEEWVQVPVAFRLNQ